MSLELFLATLSNFYHVPLLRNHNSNLCNDHDNKINLLQWLAAPSILFKFYGTNVNSLTIKDAMVGLNIIKMKIQKMRKELWAFLYIFTL